MLEITLKVPDGLTRLPEAERDRLIRAGLHEAIRARVQQLKSEIVQSKEEVARFEKRYGMPFSRFEVEVLAQNESFQAHDDYNDWYYWQSVLEEKLQLLEDLTAVESQ
jgi:hypothetical protein